jgi:branched-chain amino acid transport system substrate-binding protein
MQIAKSSAILFGLLLLGASMSTAVAQISDNVVKLGVLTDMSGPASTPTGQGSVTAAQMAIDDFGGTVLGKPVQLIFGDHQLKPDIGAGIARRWYDIEQVDLILDVPVSSVGLAVQNVAKEKQRLMITQSTGRLTFTQILYSLYHAMGVRHSRARSRDCARSHQTRREDLVLHH